MAQLIRYKHRNMWLEDTDSNLQWVYSYDTPIGIIDWDEMVFHTWGYHRYSTTTSKQITMLCREQHLERHDICEEDYQLYMKNIKGE